MGIKMKKSKKNYIYNKMEDLFTLPDLFYYIGHVNRQDSIVHSVCDQNLENFIAELNNQFRRKGEELELRDWNIFDYLEIFNYIIYLVSLCIYARTIDIYKYDQYIYQNNQLLRVDNTLTARVANIQDANYRTWYNHMYVINNLKNLVETLIDIKYNIYQRREDFMEYFERVNEGTFTKKAVLDYLCINILEIDKRSGIYDYYVECLGSNYVRQVEPLRPLNEKYANHDQNVEVDNYIRTDGRVRLTTYQERYHYIPMDPRQDGGRKKKNKSMKSKRSKKYKQSTKSKKSRKSKKI
jgi:hypothetical protein